MRVLDPTINNTIDVYLRQISQSGSCDVTLINEGTGATETSTIANVANNLLIPILSGKNEGDNYSLKVSDGGTVLYRTKIFFTSQISQNYSINE